VRIDDHHSRLSVGIVENGKPAHFSARLDGGDYSAAPRAVPRASTPPAPSLTPIQREADIRPIERKLPSDLEIPTFIRRQMD
jgi:hypothetical protein